MLVIVWVWAADLWNVHPTNTILFCNYGYVIKRGLGDLAENHDGNIVNDAKKERKSQRIYA